MELPVELMLMVFHSVDSPQDLYSLIRTSRKCHAVFLMEPVRILTSVIKNTFSPTVLPLALTVHDLSSRLDRQRAEQIEGAGGRLWRDDSDRRNFAINYESETAELPTNWEPVSSLCRLAGQISWFVTMYCEETMDQLYGTYRDSDTSNISSFERARLQRAFLRLEIYCRMRVVDNRPSPPTRSRIGWPLFAVFDQLEPWEFEELNSIHTFLFTKVYESYTTLRQELTRHVMSAPNCQIDESVIYRDGIVYVPPQEDSGTQGNTDGTTNGEADRKDEEREGEEMVYFAQDMNERGLGLYTQSGDVFVRTLVHLGLGFLESLFRSDAGMLRLPATLRRCADVCGGNEIDDFGGVVAYRDSGESRARRARARINADSKPEDHPSNPSYGWMHLQYFPSQITLRISVPRRMMGYVFWDARRIRSRPVWRRLHQAEGDKELAILPKDNLDNNSQYYFPRSLLGCGPHIQCYKAKMPKREMDRILETFALPPDFRPWEGNRRQGARL